MELHSDTVSSVIVKNEPHVAESNDLALNGSHGSDVFSTNQEETENLEFAPVKIELEIDSKSLINTKLEPSHTMVNPEIIETQNIKEEKIEPFEFLTKTDNENGDRRMSKPALPDGLVVVVKRDCSCPCFFSSALHAGRNIWYDSWISIGGGTFG